MLAANGRTVAVLNLAVQMGCAIRQRRVAVALAAVLAAATVATADNFDWRSVGGQCYVTPVRDQGSAPNCYVHAAVGAVESRYMLTRNETSFLVDLSETYLGLDPVGWAAGMLTTITNSGAQTEDGAGPGFCRITSSCSTISGSLDVIKSYLKRYGALAVTVGGHGCTLVGYQDDASLTAGGYWIIKDSFGTDWEGIPGSPGYTAALYGTLVPNRTCAVTGVAYFTGPLGARTWDTSDAAGCQGGSGTWSTSAAGWDGGRYRIAWHNGEDTATFGASNGAAVVTLDGRVSTYCLTFQTGGSYTLRGGSLVVTGGGICTNESTVLDTAITAGAPQTWTTANLCTLRVTQPVDFHISSLTIGGDGNTILEAGVRDVSLNPVFAGLVTNEYGGLGKSGAGTLSLGGHSQYCHDTTINQGALILDGNLICGGNIVLGTTGSATFIQRSGLCLLGGSVYVGCQAGASGRYQLLAGHVQEANAYVGVGGTGVFEQVDGNHACSTLTVGSSGSAGTYSLLAGTLQTTDEAVGPGGTFHQSGGLHSAGTLSVEAGGRFDLAGGTLTINRSFSVAGIVDFAGCGVLTVTTAAIDLSHADVRNPGQAAIHMDGNSVLVLPAGASESGYFGLLDNPGFSCIAGSALVIPVNRTLRPLYELPVIVDVHGLLLAPLGDGVRVVRGLMVSAGGKADLGAGYLHVDDPCSGMSGGSLVTPEMSVGRAGNGVFTQADGNCIVTSCLYAGYSAGSYGRYIISGGVLSDPNAYVGLGGRGNITQSGGQHNVAGNLVLGSAALSEGVYRLCGTGKLQVTGELRVGSSTAAGRLEWFHDDGLAASSIVLGVMGTLAIGFDANMSPLATGKLSGGAISGLQLGALEVTNGATIKHTAATTTTLDGLHTGSASGSGTYSLQVAGHLVSRNEYIGDNGAGFFTHGDGNNIVTSGLYVGYGADSNGVYTMSGTRSRLAAPAEFVGYGGVGSITQSDGNNAISGALQVGYQSGSNGHYLLKGSGRLWDANAYVGSSGTGVFEHEDGNHVVAGALIVGANSGASGVYTLRGAGRLWDANAFIGYSGTGTFEQLDGNHNVAGTVVVGANSGASGLYSLKAGKANLGTVQLGLQGQGTFVQTGGTCSVTRILTVGAGSGGEGEYDLFGGTLAMTRGTGKSLQVGGASSEGTFLLGDAAGTGTLTQAGAGLGVNMTVTQHDSARGFCGWGVVGLTGGLTNNGKITADGYGVNRLLDLSAFTSVANTIENTGECGWYATRRGALTLPAVTVATGAHTYNWGENSSDVDIDLVNSVRMAFEGVTSGGSFFIRLLASDRTDVPLLPDAVGVWDLTAPTNFAFASADLVFRYDDALVAALGASESGARLYHYIGGRWVDVTSGIDTVNHRIWANDMTSFSPYAVAVPEPATAVVAGLAMLLTLRRRRRAKDIHG